MSKFIESNFTRLIENIYIENLFQLGCLPKLKSTAVFYWQKRKSGLFYYNDEDDTR